LLQPDQPMGDVAVGHKKQTGRNILLLLQKEKNLDSHPVHSLGHHTAPGMPVKIQWKIKRRCLVEIGQPPSA